MGFLDKMKDKAKDIAREAAENNNQQFKEDTIKKVQETVVHQLLEEAPESLAQATEDEIKKYVADNFPEGTDSELLNSIMDCNISGVSNALNNGEDINITDTSGDTALLYAVGSCELDIIRLLIEKGANEK